INFVNSLTPLICSIAINQEDFDENDIDWDKNQVYLKAIEYDYKNINFIKNPNSQMCSICLSNKNFDDSQIAHNIEDIYIKAVEYDFKNISYIKEPSYKVCFEAIKQRKFKLKDIENQSYNICFYTVQKDPFAIQHVKEQDIDICLEAVRINGMAIEFINNPKEEICIEAIKQNGYAIQFINNPSEEVIKIASETVNDVSEYIINESYEEIDNQEDIKEEKCVEVVMPVLKEVEKETEFQVVDKDVDIEAIRKMLLVETQMYIDKRLAEIVGGSISKVEDNNTQEKDEDTNACELNEKIELAPGIQKKESIETELEVVKESKEGKNNNESNIPNLIDIRNKIKSKYIYLEANSIEFLSNAEYFYKLNIEGMIDYSHIALNYFKVIELELNTYLVEKNFIYETLPLGDLVMNIGYNLKDLKSLSYVQDILKDILEYRNECAHTGITSKVRLNEIREFVFNKGLLNQILNIKKSIR
ncbi:MAG: DUF4116 domain-containing protein, partial [Paraclostridium sp.]